jgi:enamine deaminase RidA (YjgF/YER057c/UK114 family)
MSGQRARAVIPPSMVDNAAIYQYSPAVVVPAGDLLFVSGQVGLDPHRGVLLDPEEQFVKAFENLDTVLRSAGTEFANVVELTSYHTAMEYVELFMRVKERFMTSEPHPAWSIIGASALGRPELLVEIKAIATLASRRAEGRDGR